MKEILRIELTRPSRSPTIPWLRVFVEGVVIVGSILLAFGIQAWSSEVDGQFVRTTTALADGWTGEFIVQEDPEKGRSVFLGALVGAAVGGGLGAAGLTAADDCAQTEALPICLSRGQAFLVGAGIGAVVGAIAGWQFASGRTAGRSRGANRLSVWPILGPQAGVQGWLRR